VYAEVLAEKQEQTLIGILSRGVAWVNGKGNHYAETIGSEYRRVISEIGPGYASSTFRKNCNVM
jgi:hypothetical protein